MKTELLKENLDLMEKLKSVPLLHSFGKKDMNKLLSFSKIKKYSAGEIIIEEGSYDNWFIFWWPATSAFSRMVKR